MLTERKKQALTAIKVRSKDNPKATAIIKQSIDGHSGSAYALSDGRVEVIVWGCGVNIQDYDAEAQAYYDALSDNH